MVKFTGLILFSLFFVFAGCLEASDTGRTFVINYEKNSFYMDGKPFRYVSGSLHYFRIPNQYWRDRLRKMRAAGLNAISTYVEWSAHEKVQGQYDFSGDLNIKKFIKIAQEEGLYVILRPGPYICAERDFGGLPYWLLKTPGIKLRTNDSVYKAHVEKWLDILMTKISPSLYGYGGPIIMVQVENEYGSYHICDKVYLNWLRDLFKKYVKNSAVLFTTDGGAENFLKCGKIPDVYATIDFGSRTNVTKAFEAQRKFEPKGPLVNSEYYPGWLTHWGEKMARVETGPIIKTLKEMLDMGANVNFYMFHGGTNFGFTAGANFFDKYQADITSYDYDAPISEAGDINEKYNAIRNLLVQYFPVPNITVNNSAKGNYGAITLKKVARILSPTVRQQMGKLFFYNIPVPFEDLNNNFGYVLYEIQIPRNISQNPKAKLEIKQISDLANVYFNGRLLGNMSREFKTDTIEIPNINQGGLLSIMVENLGRINFGSFLHDKKGILSPVTLNKIELRPWNMTTFALEDLQVIDKCARTNNSSNQCDNGQGFVFYHQKFVLPEDFRYKYPLDTYLDVSSLTKGLVFINGVNLGRYWSTRGPQYTLYVPGVYLKHFPLENTLVIMDENIERKEIRVRFTKNPILK